ncbi:MAG: efflux RND transporter periplasmic adaptor subunit, partial [Candidatus Eremiobacteraeota bacterium]|nr:efflux RND transporter periplasmic adaptor subunit [Candidatus Eremiobacteraeota bacterium]
FEKVESRIEITGTVAARDKLTVGSEVNGLRIEQVLVEEGDWVGRGQTLATLNSSLLEARLQQLRARYNQAEAALSKARQPNRQEEIAALELALHQAQSNVELEQSNLALAKANLENARQNAERYQNLYESGAIAAEQVENRQTEFRRQQAQVRAAHDRIEAAQFARSQAKERLDQAKSGGRAEDVEIARASLNEIGAQIEELQAQLAQTRIVAPDSGWILTRSAHLGSIASAGSPLFTIARGGQLELLGELPETDLDRIDLGQAVQVSHGETSVEGSIWKISPQVDETTRTAIVRVALPDRSALRPGMFAKGEIQLGHSEVLTVPAEAVRGESPDYFVYLLEDTTARRQPIQVARRSQDLVAIKQGLKAGQKVIVEGAGLIRDGDTVSLQ